ncbi:hypothetical protein WJX73_004399 [Symbiochloris irregularis]|uniref:Adenylate kinase n=1 Tax=Symbiochloris irregularis TaxID=706552 RepID=A0AAW1PK95_9CHLO
MHELPRRSASKYDFVKVKVWLGHNPSHYYILSRFLISRMLTVTKIKHTKAVQIALELKKYLVDHSWLEVPQDKLEAVLFDVMLKAGFGPEYVVRYKMVTRFFQQRRPLIILLFGVPCTGKSTVAQQLASVLNLPNVLQTDIIYELLRSSLQVGLEARPLWARGLEGSALLDAFKQECQVVRRGLDGDLAKCIRDGKSMIIEGSQLDPGLFLHEFGRYGVHTRLTMPSAAARTSGDPADDAYREQSVDLTAGQLTGADSWPVRPDAAGGATDLATLSLSSARDASQRHTLSQVMRYCWRTGACGSR